LRPLEDTHAQPITNSRLSKCIAGAGRQADEMTSPSERPGDSITGTAQSEAPHVGIFWVVQPSDGEARLLTAGCPLDQAEPYGDCLTYGPGHYETWAQWRRDKTIDPALRTIVRSSEYEAWPRGRELSLNLGDGRGQAAAA